LQLFISASDKTDEQKSRIEFLNCFLEDIEGINYIHKEEDFNTNLELIEESDCVIGILNDGYENIYWDLAYAKSLSTPIFGIYIGSPIKKPELIPPTGIYKTLDKYFTLVYQEDFEVFKEILIKYFEDNKCLVISPCRDLYEEVIKLLDKNFSVIKAEMENDCNADILDINRMVGRGGVKLVILDLESNRFITDYVGGLLHNKTEEEDIMLVSYTDNDDNMGDNLKFSTSVHCRGTNELTAVLRDFDSLPYLRKGIEDI